MVKIYFKYFYTSSIGLKALLILQFAHYVWAEGEGDAHPGSPTFESPTSDEESMDSSLRPGLPWKPEPCCGLPGTSQGFWGQKTSEFLIAVRLWSNEYLGVPICKDC